MNRMSNFDFLKSAPAFAQFAKAAMAAEQILHRDDIDKNTYQIFELENGNPTYGYELAQAVQDGYLVDYLSVEAKLKFLEQGIIYDELSAEDKENYENTFQDENGELVDHIASSALNKWGFNEDTIRRVLDILMTQGLRIHYGERLGKTIIFAKNHFIEYIVHNGTMTDLSVLQEPPFTDQGSIVEVFTNLSVWMGIRSIIDRINANACIA